MAHPIFTVKYPHFMTTKRRGGYFVSEKDYHTLTTKYPEGFFSVDDFQIDGFSPNYLEWESPRLWYQYKIEEYDLCEEWKGVIEKFENKFSALPEHYELYVTPRGKLVVFELLGFEFKLVPFPRNIPAKWYRYFLLKKMELVLKYKQIYLSNLNK